MTQPRHQNNGTVALLEMPKPDPSDWGKLSAGQSFEMLASDIRRAIFGAGWGRYEMIVVGVLIEESWASVRSKGRDAWPDPKPCRINFSGLAKELGVTAQRLYEARDSLIAKRFAIEDEDGLWINKNADEWRNPESGEPLLNPRMIAYALKARSRKDRRDRHVLLGIEGGVHSRQTVNAETTNGEVHSRSTVKCIHAGALPAFTPDRELHSRSTVNADASPLRTPIEERVRGDSSDSSDSKNIHTPREAPKPAADVEPFEAGGKDTSPPGPGPAIREPADLAQVEEAIALLESDERTEPVARALFREHNGAALRDIEGWRWICAARAVQAPSDKIKPSARRSIAYLRTCAENARREDLDPPKPKPKAAGNGVYRQGPKEVPASVLYPVVEVPPEYYQMREAARAKADASKA